MSDTTQSLLPVLPVTIPPLVVGKYTFHSRLLVGTGKYPDMPSMQMSLKESGCDVVTVAVRRANLNDRGIRPVCTTRKSAVFSSPRPCVARAPT